MGIETQEFANNLVVYLHFEKAGIHQDTLDTFESAIDGKLCICASWSELIDVLNIKHTFQSTIVGAPPIVVLLNIKSLLNHNTTVSEIYSMVITLCKCLTINCPHMMIGAVVDKSCTPDLVKQLRKADFGGLIPAYDIMGIEKTIEGVNTLLDSKLYWPKDVIDTVCGITKKVSHQTRIDVLTDRQQEVMDLICSRGLSNKEIAIILKISECTVKIHVGVILKKYGLKTRMQLATKIAKNSI